MAILSPNMEDDKMNIANVADDGFGQMELDTREMISQMLGDYTKNYETLEFYRGTWG